MISGGTSTTPGFPTRMLNDIEYLYKDRILKNPQADLKKSKIKIKLIVLIFFFFFSMRGKFTLGLGPSKKKVQCVYWFLRLC